MQGIEIPIGAPLGKLDNDLKKMINEGVILILNNNSYYKVNI